MEDYFDVDVDALLEIADLSQKAESAIIECASVLKSLLSHEDWHCKEKELIDNDILKIKKVSDQLSIAFSDYASAVRQISSRYIDFINEEKEDMLEIEARIGEFYSLLSTGVVTTVNSGNYTSQSISSIDNIYANAYDSNVMTNMNNGIQLVDFQNLANGFTIEE